MHRLVVGRRDGPAKQISADIAYEFRCQAVGFAAAFLVGFAAVAGVDILGAFFLGIISTMVLGIPFALIATALGVFGRFIFRRAVGAAGRRRLRPTR